MDCHARASCGRWHPVCFFTGRRLSGEGTGMSIERIISVGLLGWLVVGIVLMGLDIW
nr:hypothetical protein [Nitrospirota bacterium]